MSNRAAESERAGRREFAFELALCDALERERDAVVARQLGAGVERPGGRVLDAIVLEPGPSFELRAALTPERIPDAAIASDVGPGRFRPVTDAVDASPERARAVAERAAEVGFFELERRGGSLCARQVARYPDDWFGQLVGVENKPDLSNPGALVDQLRTDACLGLVDRVVLATESHVTGAHLNRIPEPVGVWRVQRDPLEDRERTSPIEVIREPEPLPVEDWGTELLERRSGGADVAFAAPEEKARARRRLAERAYGKGWRPDELPGCARVAPDVWPGSEDSGSGSDVDSGTQGGSSCLPYCEWASRVVDPAVECGPECPGFDAGEPPDVDPEAERASRTPWRADPRGRQRRQAGLDRFGERD